MFTWSDWIHIPQAALLLVYRWNSASVCWQVLESFGARQSFVSAKTFELDRMPRDWEFNESFSKRNQWSGGTVLETSGTGEGNTAWWTYYVRIMEHFITVLASQRSPARRMVHVIPVCQLQQHLPPFAQISQTAPSRKSRISERKSLASRLVSERLRLLSTMHEGAEVGDEPEQERLPHWRWRLLVLFRWWVIEAFLMKRDWNARKSDFHRMTWLWFLASLRMFLILWASNSFFPISWKIILHAFSSHHLHVHAF